MPEPYAVVWNGTRSAPMGEYLLPERESKTHPFVEMAKKITEEPPDGVPIRTPASSKEAS